MNKTLMLAFVLVAMLATIGSALAIVSGPSNLDGLNFYNIKNYKQVNITNGTIILNPLNTGNVSYYPLDIYSYNDYGNGNHATNGLVRFIGNGNLGYNKIVFDPEGLSAGDKVILQVHNRNWVDNATHKHMSIYTTNSSGGFAKRWNLAYDVDTADYDLRRVNVNLPAFNEADGDGPDGSTLKIGQVRLIDTGNGTGPSELQIAPSLSASSSSTATVSLFRITNTSGTRSFTIYAGDGSSTTNFNVDASTGFVTAERYTLGTNFPQLRSNSGASSSITILAQRTTANSAGIDLQTINSTASAKSRVSIQSNATIALVSVTADAMLQLVANTTTMTCGASQAGGIYYDGTTKKHYGCNSTAWNALY